MTRDESPDRTKQLIHQSQDAQACTAGMKERIVETAWMLAATEEQVAGTLERLAAGRPDRAEWLAALSASARAAAAQERQWAEDHSDR